MKLMTKMILFLVGVIIIPLLLAIGFTYISTNNSIINIENNNVLKNLKTAESYFQSKLLDQRGTAVTWSLWTDFYNALKNKDRQWMEDNIVTSSVEDNTSALLVLVMHKDGEIISQSANAPEGYDTACKMLVKRLNEDVYVDAGIQKIGPSLYFNSICKVVVAEDKEFKNSIGYVFIAREFKPNLIDQFKSLTGLDFMIKFNDGSTIKTQNSLKTAFDLKDFKNSEIKVDLQKAQSSMIIKSESLFDDVQGNPMGILLVEAVDKQGIEALNKLLFNSGFLIFIVFIVFILLLLWFNKKLIKPIKSVTAVIRMKDLTQTVKVVAKDEIGILAKEFNEFVEQIKSLINNVKSTAEMNADIGQMLKSANEETCKASVCISESASEIADKLSIQSNQIADSRQQIEILSTIMENISKGVGEVYSSNIDVVNKSREGLIFIKSIIDKIYNIKESSLNANKVIQELDSSSLEINKISISIKTIADQTNLLSLNAAIEAARSGEAGKGFAVVADEIRKLAEQSNKSIKTINSIATKNQTDTGNAVKLMDQGYIGIVEGEKVATDAGTSFENIVKFIEKTSENMLYISSVSNELNEVKNTISKMMNNLTYISEEIYDAVLNQLAATEGQTVQMEKSTSTSSQLAEAASKLVHEISSFKIK